MMPIPPVIHQVVKLLEANTLADADPSSQKNLSAILALLADTCDCAHSAEKLVSIAPNIARLNLTVHATVQPSHHILIWPVDYVYSQRHCSELASSVESSILEVPLHINVKCMRLLLDAAGFTRHKKAAMQFAFDTIRGDDIEHCIRRVFAKLQRLKPTCTRYADLAGEYHGKLLRVAKIRSFRITMQNNSSIDVDDDEFIVGYALDREPNACDKERLYLTVCCMLWRRRGDMEEDVLRADAAHGLGIEGCNRFGVRCAGGTDGQRCNAISGA